MIIAIAGLPRVGKTTIANYLKDSFHNVVTYSFAEPIRRGISELFGWDLSSFDDDSKNTIDDFYGVSKRQIMEYLGTSILRDHIRKVFPLFDEKIGEKIWVKRCEKFIEDNKDRIIVISDLRHTIEYEFLKNRKDTFLIYVERNNYKDLDKSKSYDIESMNFDFIIRNNVEEDDMQNLYDQAVNIFLQIKESLK